MAGVTVLLDGLCVGASRDPDAPGAGGTGVAMAVEQEPAVGRFRDIETSEARCIRV
jgi:hypothetical protein